MSGGELAELVAVLLLELAQRPVPKLPDSLTGHAHHAADLLQRAAVSVIRTEIQA